MTALNIDWMANKNLQQNAIEIAGFIVAPPGQPPVVVMPLSFTTNLEEGKIIPGAMTLSKESAQSLLDELWDCGIRPSNGEGASGELEATKLHLDDMRTMVFSLMELKK